MSSVQRRTLMQALAISSWALVAQQTMAVPDATRWSRLPDLPEVPLLDHDGQTIYLPRLLSQSRVTLVNFMFTGCATVCPPGTAILRDALQLLREQPETRDALCVSITVDPLADGPAQLRQYAKRYGIALGGASGWAMVTGTMADMGRTLSALGVSASAPSAHPSLVWLGDGQRQRWTRVSGLNPPQSFAKLALELRR
jgi:protein SCO1